MKPEKRWTLKPAEQDSVNQIFKALNIHPALCRILALRGVKDFDT